MRIVRARSLLAFAIATMLAACGDGGQTATEDGSPAPPAEAPAEPANDEAAVTQVVVTYFGALAGRDYATACLQLGPEAQQDVARITQIPGDCEDALDVEFEGYSQQELADLRDVPITAVDVSGDTATVTIEGATGPVPLERSGGAWLISGFAGA